MHSRRISRKVKGGIVLFSRVVGFGFKDREKSWIVNSRHRLDNIVI
ncbi:hypothetical protein ACFP3I_24460 [Chryseobacterium arachidis]